MRRLFALLILSCLSCKEAPSPSDNPLLAPPVNAALNVSARQALGWKYQRALQADLNGDGSEELVVLASDVVVNEKDIPLWEDGHRWAVVVRERESDTLVFSSFVPNGFVEAAISTASSEGGRELFIQERTPSQVRSIVVSYQEPGSARTVSGAYYQIEQWIPGSARLTE
ncbi:MAG TPA: hypothetical protein VNM67_09955 [Thermoanaerobaculia bacterium]|jgi:hypothetical protein|nr:hypothetical protein [Thermoanaerobaculia bacterium]